MRAPQVRVGATHGKRAACRLRRSDLRFQDLIGSSEPVPFGVLIVSHVPFGTYFQALP